MLRTGFEDACYEHIPLVNSGEDNQIIQLKRMLIKARSHTAHDCSKLFSADISQMKNCEFFIVAYFTRGLRRTHTPRLSTWLYLRFSHCKKILPILVSIVL